MPQGQRKPNRHSICNKVSQKRDAQYTYIIESKKQHI